MDRTAAVYLRVSTDEQTVENQRAPLVALAESRGWRVTVYEETESAAKRRPVFEAMLSAVHRGEHSAIVVAALDRLGRSLPGILETVRKLDEAGCAVVSLREAWLELNGPARSLLVAIFAWVAEQERAVLIDRTKAGQRRARKEGKHLGRPKKSPVLVTAAADRVLKEGVPVDRAAKSAGVSERTVRRELQARGAQRISTGHLRGHWFIDELPR